VSVSVSVCLFVLGANYSCLSFRHRKRNLKKGKQQEVIAWKLKKITMKTMKMHRSELPVGTNVKENLQLWSNLRKPLSLSLFSVSIPTLRFVARSLIRIVPYDARIVNSLIQRKRIRLIYKEDRRRFVVSSLSLRFAFQKFVQYQICFSVTLSVLSTRVQRREIRERFSSRWEIDQHLSIKTDCNYFSQTTVLVSFCLLSNLASSR